jgi:hypothetical protein
VQIHPRREFDQVHFICWLYIELMESAFAFWCKSQKKFISTVAEDNAILSEILCQSASAPANNALGGVGKAFRQNKRGASAISSDF